MRDMLLSATDWAFWPKAKDPDSYYACLKRLGYAGVEMVKPARWAQARAAGLSILNISAPGMARGLNRREHHAELLPQLRDTIALAGANGIPQVVVFSGNRAGQPNAEGIANCRIGLEAVLPDALRQHVTLVFEMLNSYEHVDYQADQGAYGFELVRQINSPGLRLLYDIYHMERMGEACRRDIIAHLPAIAHFHVADTPRRTKPQRDGGLDYSKIVPAVIQAGYQGFWGMEFMPQNDPLAELAEARAYLIAAGSDKRNTD